MSIWEAVSDLDYYDQFLPPQDDEGLPLEDYEEDSEDIWDAVHGEESN